MAGRRILGGYAFLVYVFLYAPILVVVAFAFNGGRDVLFWEGFSTKWFRVALETPEITEMLDAPPEWLQDWGKQVGANLEDGLRENPSWIAFARENGTVYHTYTVSAPDPFVAPYYSFLQERTPNGADDSEPRSWRKDEYPT